MVGRRLPKPLDPNPKPFVDVSAGLMNVPSSVSGMSMDGVIDPVARSEGLKPNRVIKKALSTKRPKTFVSVKANGRGFKAGRKEARSLTRISRKRQTRSL